MSAAPQAPRWALVVGALGICFGAVGLLGGAQDLAWPYLVEIQKQAAQRIGESLQWSLAAESGAWLDRPDWYPAYADAMAGVRILLGALMIVASTALITVRRHADRFFLLVTAASAARHVVAAVIGVVAGSLLAWFTVIAALFGFLLDAALWLSCRLSRRDVYRGVSAGA